MCNLSGRKFVKCSTRRFAEEFAPIQVERTLLDVCCLFHLFLTFYLWWCCILTIIRFQNLSSDISNCLATVNHMAETKKQQSLLGFQIFFFLISFILGGFKVMSFLFVCLQDTDLFISLVHRFD